MIAEIVPYARTPRTMTVFDYRIPEGMTVLPGDSVLVPFRKRELCGLVLRTKQETTQPARDISKVIHYPAWATKTRREWLIWFSEFYAISPSHAFKTLQYPLPKRPKKLSSITHLRKEEHYTLPQLIRAQRYVDIVAWYAKEIPHWSGHTLIICPEYADVERLYGTLSHGAHYLYYRKEPTMTELVELEICLSTTTEPLVVVGTKKMLQLNLSYFAQCIIDQEESQSHKQTDLNPRYHVRRVVERYAEIAHKHHEHAPRIMLTSIAPSIESFARTIEKEATYTVLPHLVQESQVRIVNMEEEREKKNFTWFSESVIEHMKKAKHTLLFLNRTGQYSHTVCAQCSAVSSPTQTRCASCGSVTLRTVHKGIEQLEKELRAIVPHVRIGRIDSTISDEKIAESLNSDGIILATEKIFRVTPLSFFDYIGILSVDHILAYPHYRSHERVYQLLRSFFSEDIRIDVQTSAPNHPVIQAAAAHNYEMFAYNEIEIRSLLHYPPYGYRARLINTRTRRNTLISTLPEKLDLDVVLDPEY